MSYTLFKYEMIYYTAMAAGATAITNNTTIIIIVIPGRTAH